VTVAGNDPGDGGVGGGGVAVTHGDAKDADQLDPRTGRATAIGWAAPRPGRPSVPARSGSAWQLHPGPDRPGQPPGNHHRRPGRPASARGRWRPVPAGVGAGQRRAAAAHRPGRQPRVHALQAAPRPLTAAGWRSARTRSGSATPRPTPCSASTPRADRNSGCAPAGPQTSPCVGSSPNKRPVSRTPGNG
jgi:hypothetical protein